jgi:serine/threonine protein kinase
MKQINHHSIIKLHEVYETERLLYLVMDYMDDGEL